jgi:hypothetical protein
MAIPAAPQKLVDGGDREILRTDSVRGEVLQSGKAAADTTCATPAPERAAVAPSHASMRRSATSNGSKKYVSSTSTAACTSAAGLGITVSLAVVVTVLLLSVGRL